MPKDIIVIGDIEMGGGTLTDDFISDTALSELIHSLSDRLGAVDLILNGDTFDFLKCPHKEKNTHSYPRHITVEVSLNKLAQMHRAHKRVFLALKKFLGSPEKRLFFIVGNHDHDLFFPEVQDKIKELLGGTPNILFPGLKYHEYGVWVEHGQQYDFMNRVNFRDLFLNYKGKSILQFPWVSYGLLSHFMDMKEQHPFIERISPRPLLFSLHSMVLRKVSFRSLGYFLKSVLYYPFRFYSDPTYNIPSKMFGELLRRLKHHHWDVDEIVNVFRRKRKRSNDQIFVLGHIHKMQIDEHGKYTIIHPGSWRDEYDLDASTRTLVPKKKYYVDIQGDEGNLKYEVKNYPLQRSVFLFDDVRQHELEYIHLAAREEGFQMMV